MKIFSTTCWLLIGFLVLSLFWEPLKDASAETTDDLKWQMKQIEEVVRKQQELLEDLRMKVELREEIAQSSVSAIEESEIEQVIDSYMMKEETKKKMVKAGLLPQIGAYWDKGLRFNSEDGNFKFKLGGRIMNDWGWFDEDNDLLRNSGDQVDSTEFRRARLYLSGDIYENIVFKIDFGFASGGRPSFKDMYMELKEIPVLGHFRVGHFKEPFSLEYQTSSKYIMFMERGLNNVFAPERNTGFMSYNHALDKRMTWAMGVFRNANGFGDSEGDRTTEGGYSFSGRLTGLPLYEDEGRKLVHVGLSYTYQNAFENAIRFRSRPEMHMADRFVDTGTFDAEYSHRFNPEVAIVYGPFSLQAEYTYVDVELEHEMVGDAGDPNFDAFYISGSYFLTGEHRKYKTTKGAFNRIKPNKNFHWGWGKGKGALELTARFSSLDLSDEDINGGRLDDITLGANWYLNPNTRVMLNYVHADVDPSITLANEEDGNADLLGMRFQIDF